MAQAFHQHGTDVLFIERLLNIGDDIIGVLDTYREADQVRSHASLYQLLIAQLAVRMTGRVKHASTGIRYVSFKLSINLIATSRPPFNPKDNTPQEPFGRYFLASSWYGLPSNSG